jgi:hypothetical protein
MAAVFRASNTLPEDFHFHKNQLCKPGAHAVFGGAFADVYKSRWLDIPVAVKVLRTMKGKAAAEMEKVPVVLQRDVYLVADCLHLEI